MTINTLKCLRCNHFWIPRTDQVKECPKCKSRNWNKLKPFLQALIDSFGGKDEKSL